MKKCCTKHWFFNRLLVVVLACLSAALVSLNAFAQNENIDPPPYVPPEDDCGDPVGIITGNAQVYEVDVVIPCPIINLEFHRSYNSYSEYDGYLGRRWSHSYDWRLSFEGNKILLSSIVDATLGPYNGFTRHFIVTNNTYSAIRQNDYRLEQLESGEYDVAARGGLHYLFSQDGVLSKVYHLAGPEIALTYASNLLVRAEHSNGQYLDFSYTNDLIREITTPSTNLSVTFFYSDHRALTNAVRHTCRGAFATSYEYQSSLDGSSGPEHNRMTKRVNANGRSFNYIYDKIDGASARCREMNIETNYYKMRVEYDPPHEILKPLSSAP